MTQAEPHNVERHILNNFDTSLSKLPEYSFFMGPQFVAFTHLPNCLMPFNKF